MPLGTLFEKGCSALNRRSNKYNDFLRTVPGDKIHSDCRNRYTRSLDRARTVRPSLTAEQEASTSSRVLRLTFDSPFNFKTNCLFCGQFAEVGTTIKTGTVVAVRTLKFKETLLECCNLRNDDWANAVRARLLNAHDMHAADAVYHQTCSVNFRTNRNIPQSFKVDESQSTVKRKKCGRPENEAQMQAFLSTAKYLQENDDEQITITNLVDHMQHLLVGCELNACLDTVNDVYAPYHEMQDIDVGLDFIPLHLQLFLFELFGGKEKQVKVAFIGQAIMQAIRPRVLLVPMQVGLGVQLHHQYASRFLD